MKCECPVCGKKHEVKYWSEEPVGTVEFHMYCDRCGYFADMCYSKVYEGIFEGYPEKYKDTVKELGLQIYSPEICPPVMIP